MISQDLQHLIKLLSKLPGLGPRSGRRVALHLMKNGKELLRPLAQSLIDAADRVQTCSSCGNLDSQNPCTLCVSPLRDTSCLCIVQDISDLWAMERAGMFKGLYHILGGTLSALDGVGPNELHIPQLLERIQSMTSLREVILALNLTVEGQTTAHYIAERIQKETGLAVTALAHGIPLGGELDYLDEGTLSTALIGRRPL